MDEELERLKRRKLLELQKKIEKKQDREEKLNPRRLLESCFGYRAMEVYDAAWSQYPQVMPRIEGLLIEAINSGKIKQRIDGESLYYFFRSIGIPVRLKTTIKFKEHGELKTLQDKLREKK
ncbi:double-stranded DNA-binding protein [Candidatus Bathyarchaeota archaeon]|nr:double-stranded DNA-binding protein [Candidatus Bathyarchaeota archaeon]MBS7631441.1 double-stranded DNA-binding protein [Candidatus Bathyarchaeota archaeon]